jgi:ABC-type Na+ efflux pump permease subunit
MPETRSLSLGAGTARIFELSMGELLWSRRTLFMTLLVAAPVVLAAAARLFQAGIGPSTFGLIVWVVYLGFVVPVLGVFYGTSLIADEVEDRTITYLFTRPLRRGAVLLGKYLAYLACAVLMVLPSVLIVYFLVVPFGDIPGTFTALVIDLAVLSLGLAVYGGLFACVGAATPRPLLAGLVFAFGWEPFALLMPGYLSRFTIAQYLQALVPHPRPLEAAGGGMGLLQAVSGDPPGALTSLVCLAVVLCGALWIGVRAVETREYVLEQ